MPQLKFVFIVSESHHATPHRCISLRLFAPCNNPGLISIFVAPCSNKALFILRISSLMNALEHIQVDAHLLLQHATTKIRVYYATTKLHVLRVCMLVNLTIISGWTFAVHFCLSPCVDIEEWGYSRPLWKVALRAVCACRFNFSVSSRPFLFGVLLRPNLLAQG